MEHIFIINPAAGSRDRTADYSRAIAKACGSRGLNYQIQVSREPGDCRRLAREAAASGREVRLYACGGDGTLNEVAAGAAGYENAAVTVFSGGSGNDFTRMFSDPRAFFDIERLLEPEEARLDLIRCNDDICVNIFSVGLDARIGTDVARYKRLPLLSGFRAYLISTLVNVIRGIGEHYVVEINGERIEGEQTFVCICNGQYYGGGFHPVPEADPTDGILDVLLVKKVRRLQVPMIIGKYKSGRYRELPKIVRHLRTDQVRIRCRKPVVLNLDGELRTAAAMDIRLAEEKLRFFYPRGLTFASRAQSLL